MIAPVIIDVCAIVACTVHSSMIAVVLMRVLGDPAGSSGRQAVLRVWLALGCARQPLRGREHATGG